jgi:hypothetical protein
VPLVEDTRVRAPLAASHSRVQPNPKGKGKAKAKAGIEAMIQKEADKSVATMPQEMCCHSGSFNLLCFCCPMPPIEVYNELYMGPDFLTGAAFTTSLNKNIIDLHSEFLAQKVLGERRFALVRLHTQGSSTWTRIWKRPFLGPLARPRRPFPMVCPWSANHSGLPPCPRTRCVTVWTGKTPDSAVMTTRAGK